MLLFFKVYFETSPEHLTEGEFNYISFTLWETKADFDAWRTGEAFKEAHGGGGIIDFMKLLGTALFILDGSPKPAFYDALLLKTNEKLLFATDNGWRNIPADGKNLLNSDVFLVHETFSVPNGKEIEFEQSFQSYLSSMNLPSGLVFSTLLRKMLPKQMIF